MDSSMDRSLEGRKTQSEQRRERELEMRKKLDDKEKFEQWKAKHQGAVGTVQLPIDISALPSCGCTKPSKGKDSKGLRMTRGDVSQEWQHFACPKKDEPGAGNA